MLQFLDPGAKAMLTKMRLILIIFLFSSGIVTGEEDLPTLLPISPFDPSDDATKLFKAMDGLGANENNIIDILCYRTAIQRDQITMIYNDQHGSLIGDLESELNGNFQTLSVMLTYSTAKFLAIELHETMAPRGMDEPSLTEVIMSRSNQELKEIRTFYLDYYGQTLVSAIEAETSIGPYRRLLIQMAEGKRDETTTVDMTEVEYDVSDLYNGGPAMEGTEESVYVDIFSLRNFVHLNEVAKLYEETYGTPLTSVVSSEFPNEMGNACVSILQYGRDKALYFSARFHTTIAGVGTEDRNLMRLTVSRCEIDLGNIKARYQSLYGKTLSDDVKGDTSGSFQTALLALID